MMMTNATGYKENYLLDTFYNSSWATIHGITTRKETKNSYTLREITLDLCRLLRLFSGPESKSPSRWLRCYDAYAHHIRWQRDVSWLGGESERGNATLLMNWSSLLSAGKISTFLGNYASTGQPS